MQPAIIKDFFNIPLGQVKRIKLKGKANMKYNIFSKLNTSPQEKDTIIKIGTKDNRKMYFDFKQE